MKCMADRPSSISYWILTSVLFTGIGFCDVEGVSQMSVLIRSGSYCKTGFMCKRLSDKVEFLVHLITRNVISSTVQC
jgi:hypothetical protein